MVPKEGGDGRGPGDAREGHLAYATNAGAGGAVRAADVPDGHGKGRGTGTGHGDAEKAGPRTTGTNPPVRTFMFFMALVMHDPWMISAEWSAGRCGRRDAAPVRLAIMLEYVARLAACAAYGGRAWPNQASAGQYIFKYWGRPARWPPSPRRLQCMPSPPWQHEDRTGRRRPAASPVPARGWPPCALDLMMYAGAKESPLLCPGMIPTMSMYFPGATAVGVTFEGGLVLASEKRIALGNFLLSKSAKKTFPITPRVGATCAGLVADMQLLSLQIAALAKIRKMELKRDIPPNTVAKMMSNMMYERRYFPLLTQVIVGGVVGQPVMYTLDPLGSVLPDRYAAVGTGAEMALGVLDPGFREGMGEDDAVGLAKKAVRSASLRDSASGDGLDAMVITADGAREFTEKI